MQPLNAKPRPCPNCGALTLTEAFTGDALNAEPTVYEKPVRQVIYSWHLCSAKPRRVVPEVPGPRRFKRTFFPNSLGASS